MSLQPLDTTNEIPDAYALALSESRRWGNCRVVLGYSSRSTLSLRAQGIGLPELRKELEEEKEVLFGFLRFRRRGIVLQYTHPDCSRVVKARAQVHLQTVLNFFRDNDFLLETSTPKDITLDNIARLTNSTSTSTINSGKRSKRLTDIMEESPIQAYEEMEEIQSSPNSDGNSLSSNKPPTTAEEVEPPITPPSSGPHATDTTPPKPQNKVFLKPLATDIAPVSPPATPRSPHQQPPTTDCSQPSPPPSAGGISPPRSPLPILDFRTPSPIPAFTTPPTPPTPPEKLRLLKALEIRRQKLAGNQIVKIPKLEAPPSPKRSVELAEDSRPSSSRTSEDIAGFMEAQRRALEEQKRHIAALEMSEKDLLSGWVNFQASTSLLWRRKFIRVTCGRSLILAEKQEGANAPISSGVGEKSFRWNILDDVRGVEIPDRDEEQLPHSLRINVDRGGQTFYIACQTAADMVNLRRVLGYCLNDESVFRCEG